jgi:phosphoserine phosphatase
MSGQKLVIFDMDGVIFNDTNFWLLLHEVFGTLDEGNKLTKKYLHTNYDKLVEEVVKKLWIGKDANPYYALINSMKYLNGVRETFDYIKDKKYLTAIVSGSSIDVAKRVQKDFNVDFIFANELVIKNGKVSGEFNWPIGVGKENKAMIIRDLCKKLKLSTKDSIYIGDSDADIEAFKEVGVSIAFNSNSTELKKRATYVVEGNNLLDVIKYLK